MSGSLSRYDWSTYDAMRAHRADVAERDRLYAEIERRGLRDAYIALEMENEGWDGEESMQAAAMRQLLSKTQARRAPQRAPQRGWPAKYTGQCADCRLLILLGQRIQRADSAGSFAHVDCDDSRDDSQWAAYERFRAAQRVEANVETKEAAGLDLSALPPGRTYYAVPNSDGKTTFLVVDRPDDKWAGWAFVRQFIGGQGIAQRLGSQRPGGFYRGQWEALINAVLADPQAAAERFGKELGHCGACNLPLTDEDSRARGLGPICAAKGLWG
jgi:hypothetical protein